MKAPKTSETPTGRLKISSRTTKATAAKRPRRVALRQVLFGAGGAGGAAGAGAGFGLLAAARASGAAVGVDAAALGAAALATAPFLVLGHLLNLCHLGQPSAANRRSITWRSGSKPRIGTSSG
jgi:hypothetical protein